MSCRNIALEMESARRQLLCANLNVKIARDLTYLSPSEYRKLAEERNDELNVALDHYIAICGAAVAAGSTRPAPQL